MKFLKRILPKHLLARFVLIILVPLVTLQALIGIYFYNKHWDTISRRLADDVVGEIKMIADLSVNKDDPSKDFVNK